MKRTLLFTLLAASLFSCKKEDKEPKPVSIPMQYTVNGIKSTVLYRRHYVHVPLQLKYISGPEEYVTLSVSGLPDGIKADFLENSYTGIPEFSTTLVLTAAKDADTLKNNFVSINASTPHGGVKTFKLPLDVKPVPDCADYIGYTYWADFACDLTPPWNVTEATFWRTDVSGQVHILFPYGYIYADIDCVNDRIIVSKQTVNGYTIEGSGPFDLKTADIYYTVADTNGNTGSCSVHFTSKF